VPPPRLVEADPQPGRYERRRQVSATDLLFDLVGVRRAARLGPRGRIFSMSPVSRLLAGVPLLVTCLWSAGAEYVTARSLSGFVGYTNTGTPTPGVVVERRSHDWKRVLAARTTDSQGRFSFGSVPAGTYYLRAYKRCMIDERQIVRVRAEGPDEISFVAEAGSGECLMQESLPNWCETTELPLRDAGGTFVWIGLKDVNARRLSKTSIGCPALDGDQRGDVEIQLLIGIDGAVSCARAAPGDLRKSSAVIDTVRTWRFKPYEYEGRNTAVFGYLVVGCDPAKR